MIVTRALTKRYGRVLVVDGVDLAVAEGDRYGFLGPNGSGKTTTLRMLLGLAFATSGEIEVLGEPVPRRVAHVLPQVGALVEGPAAYGVGRRPVRAYSLGMKQRLGLAAALLRRPRLLVLDEPTNGLDPRGIREVRDLLLELNRAGTTVFLSSHQLAEVEGLCTRVGILDRGRLVLQDELATLRAPTGRVVLTTPDLTRRLVAEGLRVDEVAIERRTLEDVLLEVTGAGSDRIDERPSSPAVDRSDRRT